MAASAEPNGRAVHGPNSESGNRQGILGWQEGFKPSFHINYKNAIMPIKDGLPKFKDMPADMGGSGDTMDE